jgi:hypothetical protein
MGQENRGEKRVFINKNVKDENGPFIVLSRIDSSWWSCNSCTFVVHRLLRRSYLMRTPLRSTELICRLLAHPDAKDFCVKEHKSGIDRDVQGCRFL